MKFDWDIDKARSNKSKHGVTFESVEPMFTDPLIFDDLSHSESEPRYVALGFDSRGRLLAVAFVRPDRETIRIISARKATKKETAVYANAKKNQ